MYSHIHLHAVQRGKINKCKTIKKSEKWRKMKLANLNSILTPLPPPVKRLTHHEVRDSGATSIWTLETEEMTGGKGSRWGMEI